MNFRSLPAAMLSLTILLSSGAALGQKGTDPERLATFPDDYGRKDGQKVLLTDVQLLGKNNAFRGFDEKTLNGVLMFALSSFASLEVYSSASPIPTNENLTKVPTLTSSVRDLQGAAVWTADLSLPDRGIIRLGPVVLNDGAATRLEALRTIAELVAKAFNEPQSSGAVPAVMPGTVRAICVDSGADGSARELRGNLLAALQREDIYRGSDDAALCDPRVDQRPAEEAVLIVHTGPASSIAPILKWRHGSVPLPAFTSTEESSGQDRDDYATLVARAARSYMRDCTSGALTQAALGSSGSETNRLDAGRAILARRECPLLAAALLETAGADNPEVLIDLARAYREASQPQVSARLLTRFLEKTPLKFEADLRYELALAQYEQYSLDEAVQNFKLALEKKPFPEAHARLAKAAYLIGDRETATAQLQLALLRNGFDLEARVLAIHLALDRAALRDEQGLNTGHFAEALEHAKVVLPIAPRGASAIESVVKNIAHRASAAEPTLRPNMQVAEETLTLLIDWGADDAGLYLQRGRTRIWLASEDQEKRLVALRDISKAADLKREQGGVLEPELQVIDLELSEGYFVNGKYKEAAAIAQRFLSKGASRDGTASSYNPVAYLLDYAGDVMATHARVSPKKTERFLTRIKSFSGWPSLVARISSGKSEQTVTVAQWSFGTFDSYLCASRHPSRVEVLSASRALQRQLDRSREPFKCPTPAPKRT